MPARSLFRAMRAVAALALIPCTLPAQRPPIRLAGLLGVSRTSATGVGPIDAELGGSIGATATIEISRLLGLRTEALLSRRALRGIGSAEPLVCGFEDLCTQSLAGLEETRWTDLEFPLLLEVRTPRRDGRVQAFGYAGPFMALRLGCTRASPAGQLGEFVRDCDGVAPGTTGYTYFNDLDGGLVIGGGIRLGSVGLGVRWTRGYVPLAPFQPGGDSQLINGKSSSLALLVEAGGRIRPRR